MTGSEHPAYCTCAKRTRNRLLRSANPSPKKVKPTRQDRARHYLNELCGILRVKAPLLLFSDQMQNPGA